MWRQAAMCACAALAAASVVACGGEEATTGAGDITNEEELRAVLDELAFDYTLRPAEAPPSEQAFLGTATDEGGTTLRFAVSICDRERFERDRTLTTDPCPTARIPNTQGQLGETSWGAVSYSADDTDPAPGEKNTDVTRALDMSVDIDLALCHATGEDEYGCT